VAADDQLNIKIVVDATQLTAGMSEATATVQSASAQMAAALAETSPAATKMGASLKQAGMSAIDAASAMKNLGFSAKETTAALASAGFAAEAVAAKTIEATASVSGMERAMAMASGRIAGMAGGAGMLGGALSRVGAASSTLAPILAAAFPVLGALALADILGNLYEKLRKVSMEGLENADAWQKINHESAAAMEAANKGIEQLEVKLENLTQGKMAALRLEMKQIGDGSVEMSGKMLTLFDNIGKQLEKEVPMFDKVKEFVNFINSHGVVMPNQGELAKAFGAELSKTLDTQGLAAGVHLVAQQIRELNSEIAKAPNDKGLVEYRDQLEKVRASLAAGFQKEGLEKAVNVAEQAKESAAELKKARDEIDKFNAKMQQLAKERDRITRENEKLVTDEALFFEKAMQKESADEVKELIERNTAERKFRQDRLKDIEEESIAEITAREKTIEEQLRLGQITNEQARVQLNKLVADKLAIELKYINDRASVILERMKTDDAKTYAEDLATWSKLLHDKQQAQITANATIQANNEKTAVANDKPWKTMFKSIQTGMDQMIRGILMGTQSIGQAFSRLGADLLVIMTEALAKILLKHIAHWVAVNVIEKSAALQSLATLLTGNAAKQATTSATNVAMVTSDAGVAGAAGFASAMLALPFPANVAVAPGVMAAAIASTLSMIPLAAAAGGWDVPGNIPGSGALTLIHPREMVLPANIAQGVRSMTSGGGSSASSGEIHIHMGDVHATDSRGVEKLLRQQADTLADIMRQHRREFKG
jgi:hypothetical protein